MNIIKMRNPVGFLSIEKAIDIEVNFCMEDEFFSWEPEGPYHYSKMFH